MKEIKEFIEAYINNEFQFTIMKYDILVNDEECEIQAKIINNFFHTRNPTNYRRTGIEFKDETKKALAVTNKKKAIPRTLFQIKHYQDPLLRDAIKHIVIGNDLYACYVSYPSKEGRDLYFSSIFYVSETNEGLKIIFRKSINSDTGRVWYRTVDLVVETVIEEGKLIEVEKYKAPEEATSLADYNS